VRVLFDYQIFEEQKTGGISRYVYELYKNFRSDPEIEIQLPVNFSENIYLNSLNEFQYLSSGMIHPYQKFLPWLNFKGKSKLYSLFSKKVYADTNIQNSLNSLRKNDYDIFHPSYYYTYYLDEIKDKPLVITVHDMINEIYPEYFPPDCVSTEFKKQLTGRADKIIAVSENTKKDLIKIFNISPDKIDVIYHGSSTFLGESNTKNNELFLPEIYLLYVGSRAIYKNFRFFLDSVRVLLKKNSELKIICTGQPFTKDEMDYFRINNIENNLIHYFASDTQIMQLYKYAAAFVFPSLYEGFGIPVLEAFSCGCPCALSNAGSLPEVGGDAAIYFDPRSSDSILSAINRILFDNELRGDMRMKGFDRAKSFTWEKAATETKAVYKHLI
jgi:glycosyltransferase involved in cell wall biosynthesis